MEPISGLCSSGTETKCDRFASRKTPQNLLCASIGTENVDDLIADLQQALLEGRQSAPLGRFHFDFVSDLPLGVTCLYSGGVMMRKTG